MLYFEVQKPSNGLLHFHTITKIEQWGEGCWHDKNAGMGRQRALSKQFPIMIGFSCLS
jgi:hypothetical protein